jgi:hypothetical protein
LVVAAAFALRRRGASRKTTNARWDKEENDVPLIESALDEKTNVVMKAKEFGLW